METIQKILHELGYESVEDFEEGTVEVIEGGVAFMDLTIRKISDNVILVAHYDERGGERIPDPVVKFRISDDGEWVPYEYHDHYIDRFEPNGEVDVGDFIKQWNKNLDNQGFIDRARE